MEQQPERKQDLPEVYDGGADNPVGDCGRRPP